MVPPATLHAKAHAAALEASQNGWLHGSLETGLAAAAGASHPPGSREMGEKALEALLDWRRRFAVRAIGEDAAALALGAWAARQLHGGNAGLATDAAEIAARTASARSNVVAPLHLALCAWGLRGTIGVSDAAPWPQIRERLRSSKAVGLDAPLVALARALSTAEMDAAQLARDLTAIPSVTLPEACVLLWILWTGTALLDDLMPDDDHELETVRRRRTEVYNRVAAEVGEHPFAPLEYDDFDPFADDEPDEGDRPSLDRFEALMLDLTLSGEMTGEPVRTPAEYRRAVAAARRPLMRAMTGVLLGVSVAACAAGATIAALAQSRVPFDVGVGGTLLGFGLWATFLLGPRLLKGPTPPTQYVDTAAALALCSLAVLVNSALPKPPVGITTFDGLLVAVVIPLLILAVSAWSQRSSKRKK